MNLYAKIMGLALPADFEHLSADSRTMFEAGYRDARKAAADLALAADAEIAALRQVLEDLAKAVWLLDRAGFIGTDDEESEVECAHLLRIARQTVDAYRDSKKPAPEGKT